MKKSIVIMLLLSIGTSVFAQKKVVKKATPVKRATPLKPITITKVVEPAVPQVDKKIATIVNIFRKN